MSRTSRRTFYPSLGKHIIITIMILFVLAAGTFSSTVKPAGAVTSQASLGLDGSSANGCPNYTSSCSATISTSHGNDILITFAIEQLDLQTSCTFNLSDTAGLSWTARSDIFFDPTGRTQVQEFWAVAANPLSSNMVTESISGCGNNYNNLIVFGISGANIYSPFDPNAALPGSANGYSGDTSVLVSTSNPNDMVIGSVIHGNICCFPAAGPGFTLITPPGTTAAEYDIVNATVSGLAVTFSDPAVDTWLSMADAVQAMPTTPEFAITATPSGLSLSQLNSSAFSSVTLVSLNDFSGTVSLAISTAPAGFSTSIQPSSLFLTPNGTATATLTVTSTNNITASFDVLVSGTSGVLSHSASVHVTSAVIPPPGYIITAPYFISVTAGGSTQQSVFVSSLNDFAGTVSLTASLKPSLAGGLILTLNPSNVTISPGVSAISTLAIFTSLNTTVGAYNYTIDGVAPFGGGFVHESFTGEILVVSPPQPDFFVNAYPTSLIVFAGSSATSTVQVSPAQPLSANLTVFLSATVPLVTGLTATVNPSAVTISPYSYAAYSTLTVTSLSTTPPGNYTIVFAGQAGTIIHTVPITVQVRPPPKLTVTPTSGPTGTTVLAHGSGFPVQYGPSEILVTFDDQFMGFTFTSTGSFDFTFNVPLAQSGPHTVKASESLFFPGNSSLITATAPFQVTGAPSGLSLSLTVGVVYFPGDKAVANVLVTSGGLPVSSSNLQLTITLTRPDNTKVVLNVTRLGSGLFMATYSLPKSALIGTYSLVAAAHLAGTGDSSNIASFEVKLPWLTSQQPAIAGTAGVAALALVGVALVSWRKGYFRKSSKESY